MPIYEYECHACGHRLEKLQKISDAPLSDCPACEEPGLRKLVSAAAFRLKGGGWYETDFKDEQSRRNVAKDDDKAGGKSDGAKSDGDKSDGGKSSDAGDSGAQAKDGGSKETRAKPDATGAATHSPTG